MTKERLASKKNWNIKQLRVTQESYALSDPEKHSSNLQAELARSCTSLSYLIPVLDKLIIAFTIIFKILLILKKPGLSTQASDLDQISNRKFQDGIFLVLSVCVGNLSFSCKTFSSPAPIWTKNRDIVGQKTNQPVHFLNCKKWSQVQLGREQAGQGEVRGDRQATLPYLGKKTLQITASFERRKTLQLMRNQCGLSDAYPVLIVAVINNIRLNGLLVNQLSGTTHMEN